MSSNDSNISSIVERNIRESINITLGQNQIIKSDFFSVYTMYTDISTNDLSTDANLCKRNTENISIFDLK